MMGPSRQGSQLLWLAIWMSVLPILLALLVDGTAVLNAQATLAAALTEAVRVSAGGPTLTRDFRDDLPVSLAAAASLSASTTGVTAIAPVRLPVALGPWTTVTLTAHVP